MRNTITFALVISALSISPALAQQPPPSSYQQVLGQRLMEEIAANLQLRAALLDRDAEIQKLKEPPPPAKPAK